MQDLKDVTQEVHYENYRAERLSSKGQGPPTPRKTIEAMYVNNASTIPEIVPWHMIGKGFGPQGKASPYII